VQFSEVLYAYSTYGTVHDVEINERDCKNPERDAMTMIPQPRGPRTLSLDEASLVFSVPWTMRSLYFLSLGRCVHCIFLSLGRCVHCIFCPSDGASIVFFCPLDDASLVLSQPWAAVDYHNSFSQEIAKPTRDSSTASSTVCLASTGSTRTNPT
jgi:hypothetical protein